MELEEIQEYVKTQLSEKRFYHSVCVMERSGELAGKFMADVELAKKIGIAHDVAKEMSETERMKYIKENDIEADDIEKINTGLLHAKIGADIAIKKLGFSEEMGQAIRCHTTGKIGMDIYSKILFIADRTSQDRNFEYIDQINDLLNEDIDQALLFILDEKIKSQLLRRLTIHTDGILARNDLIEKMLKD